MDFFSSRTSLHSLESRIVGPYYILRIGGVLQMGDPKVTMVFNTKMV